MTAPSLPLPRNIALIGFMGSGKTTVGRHLAERLGWKFVDTDAYIVENADGRSIPTIFSEEGESSFRDRESEVVQRVCSIERQVIATGGGAILRSENAEALRTTGLVIWLTARPDVVVARTKRGAKSRPVLAAGAKSEDELLAHILSLLAARGPAYHATSHLIVDTSDRSPASIAAEIQRKAERWSERAAEGGT